MAGSKVTVDAVALGAEQVFHSRFAVEKTEAFDHRRRREAGSFFQRMTALAMSQKNHFHRPTQQRIAPSFEHAQFRPPCEDYKIPTPPALNMVGRPVMFQPG